MKDRKKWEYANALIQLMNQRELSSITVREICKMCSARPQNFYYHFKDKYDLVEWIYKQDIVLICQSNSDKPWRETLELAYENLLSRQKFYKNAFQDDSTNALINYVLTYQKEIYTFMVARYKTAIDESMSFMINYHAFACAEVTKQWLTDPDPMPPEQLADEIMNSMPEKLKSFLNQENVSDMTD